MSERSNELTEAEVGAERRRNTWGGALLGVGGFVFAVVAMWKFQALGLATLGFAVSALAFGLVQPDQIKGLWQR